MPYKLRKCPKKDLYWVVGPDGKHHSKEGMPRKTALAQKRILTKAMLTGGAECTMTKQQCAEVNGTYYLRKCYNIPEDACKPPAEPPVPPPLKPQPTPPPTPVPEPTPKPSPSPPNPTVTYNTRAPTLYTLWRMSVAAKKASPDPVIDGWHLQHATIDLKFYTKGDCGIVAVRGTKNAEDWATNSQIPLGKAEEGTRVQRDIQHMRSERSRLASRVKYWYAVGHSLGGAICDIFIAKGLIKEAVSFNPAVEPQYARSSRNHRYYHADDPLYYFLGKNAAVAGVIPGQDYSWYDWASWAAPWTDLDYGALWAHKIERFGDFARTQGSAPTFTDWEMDMFDPEESPQRRGRGSNDLIGKGTPPTKLANHLKELGIKAEDYLEAARRKAKAAGLASELLDWASDGTHKFEIMNEEGHTVEFGAAGMGDHILYTLLKDPLADKHRKSYLARARAIKGDWRKSPYSPNSLAIKVLW